MQVFIMCSDCSLFALCPVAPFGMSFPHALVQSLGSASEHDARDEADSSTAMWLQQACSTLCTQSYDTKLCEVGDATVALSHAE